MPTLVIGDKRVKVGEEFKSLSPEEQQNAVDEIARGLGDGGRTLGSSGDGGGDDAGGGDSGGIQASGRKAKRGGVTADNLVRATARGIPILGGVMDQFAAVMDAATQPVLGRGSDAATFGERRRANVEAERAKDKAFDEESPIASTVAKVAGGVAPFFAAAKVPQAASALGLTGPLKQQIVRGAVSGAGIGAADAAVRGEDVQDAAETNAMFGALVPVAGKVIGKGYQAVRDRFRPTPAPTAQPSNTVTVNIGGRDVEVVLPTSAMEVDPAKAAQAASAEEIARKGARGEGPQRLALEADQQRDDALNSVRSLISEQLDPTGAVPRTAPQQAGEVVVQEAQRLAAQRAAAEASARQMADLEGAALRSTMGGAPARPGEAAEAVGAGTGAAAQAAARARTAAYKVAEDIPAEFDPSVRGIGEQIRARLNTPQRPDRIWVDRDNATQSSKALRALSDQEGGIFFNEAAPRGGAAAAEVPPVGGAPAAAAAPVDDTVQKLREKFGDTVADAYVKQTAAKGGPGTLAEHEVAVPGRDPVAVRPRVVEADQLLASSDQGYDQALQPRNRDKAASIRQIDEMAQKLDPKRLGASAEADRGAPIVGADGMVESGNGRVMALRKVYAEGGEKAAAYRKWLADQGVDVSKFRNPVLVRERVTPMSNEERQAFTVQANQSAGLSMSAAEKALADAKLIDGGALGAIRNPADLGAVENRPFVRQFFAKLPQTEHGALMTAKGDLTAEGLTRVRNAVLAKAYGDTPVLSRIAESTSDEVKSISNALTQAAPEWAALRQAIEAGAVPAEMDITQHLIDAVSRTARLRAKGGSLDSRLAQSDAFGGQSDESQRLMRMFYGADGRSAAPAGQIATGLRNYAQEAAKVDASPGLGLGLPPVTAKDVLENAATKAGAPKALDEAVSREATAAKPVPVEDVKEALGPVRAKEIEAARKRLVTHYTDARNEFYRSGKGEDLRAMSAIMDEFDNVIREMVAGGKVTGEGQAYLDAIEAARKSHASYRQLFSRQPGDLGVGQAIEKIVGKAGSERASPDEIARMAYGAEGSPGGGAAARVAARLKKVLGADSDQWKSYKQGLFSYLVETPDGGMREPAKAAQRISDFLNSSKGSELAKQAFTDGERRALGRYADTLRGLEARPQSRIDKVMDTIAGANDGIPMSSADVVDLVMNRVGKGNKSFSVELVKRMKQDFTPEGWTSVRQGVWSKLMDAGEGKIEMQAQALSQRMHEFLNESGRPLAEVLFSPQELSQMKQLAAIYKKMIPPKGAAPNTSNTATTLAKLANKTQSSLLPLLGFAHGGMPGAVVGAFADRGAAALAERRATREAADLFFGKQPKQPKGPQPTLALTKALARGAAMEEARD